MNRHYHSYDGDMYWIAWDGKEETAEPIMSYHTYENRVQCSEDVYNFIDLTEEELKVSKIFKNPPKIFGYQLNPILGFTDKKATKKFLYLNGLLGPKNKAHFIVLVYKNQPDSIVGLQRRHWKGGNKNEIISCVGIDNENKVQWGRVISWTHNETFKIQIRDYINEMDKIDLIGLGNFIEKNIGKSQIRRDFEEEFKHLTVNPTMTAIIISYLFILIVNIGVAIFIVKNDMDESYRSYSKRRY